MINPGLWRVRRVYDMVPQMLQLQREMNRLFSDAGHKTPAQYPAVNIWEKEGAAVVAAELPGLDPDKLDITVTVDALSIAGSAPVESPAQGETYLRQERETGPFQRTISLPFQVDAQKVEASYDRGILYVTLPRATDDLPRKIKIG